MKKLVTILLLLLITAIVHAQTSVTASDFEAQLVIGKKITTYRDGTKTSVDLGSTGQSSWDFSSLTASDEFVTENKAVGSSPYAADFSGAEYASNYEGTFQGTFSNTWVYNSVGDNYVTHGTGTVANTVTGDVKTKITFAPAQVEYKLPVDYLSTWSYSGQQTIATTITIPFLGETTTSIVQQRTRNFIVDAYGTMKMPGGKVLNALRIREENTLTGDNVNSSSVLYHFLTKTGESVSVTLNDGVTSNSGSVVISAVSWTTGDGAGIVDITVSAPTSLSAVAGENKIELSWSDNADNEDGYNVERAEGTGSFTQIAQVASNVKTYSDADTQVGVEYKYRVQAYNGTTASDYSNTVNATIATTAVEELDDVIPGSYKLLQNYPNPFNPSTKIEFIIPQNDFVTLKIYNSLGEEIATLINNEISSGKHSVNFNASKLSSGIYFYTLTSDNFIATKKLILVK